MARKVKIKKAAPPRTPEQQKKDIERRKKYPYAFKMCACGCGERLRHDAKTPYKFKHDKNLVISEVIKKARPKTKVKVDPPKPKKVAKRKTFKKPKPEAKQQMRTRVALALDHSGSMRALSSSACMDFNNTLEALRQSAQSEGVEALASVVRFGMRNPRVQVTHANVGLPDIPALNQYPAESMTPLYDGVMKAIDLLEQSPEAGDRNTALLVIAITDGFENDSQTPSSVLRQRIEKLQKTDRWTFVFRVPRGHGYGQKIRQDLGLFEGNIQEWEVSNRGLQQASHIHVEATRGFMRSVSQGTTSSRGYYQTNAKNLCTSEVKKNLADISNEVDIWFVKDPSDGGQIRDFCNRRLRPQGEGYQKGCAFYLLEDKNKKVTLQEYKVICIRDSHTGKIYGGNQARSLLGIPPGRYKLKAGDHGKWEIFVQSTSVNRKLFTGDRVLYWRAATR